MYCMTYVNNSNYSHKGSYFRQLSIWVHIYGLNDNFCDNETLPEKKSAFKGKILLQILLFNCCYSLRKEAKLKHGCFS